MAQGIKVNYLLEEQVISDYKLDIELTEIASKYDISVSTVIRICKQRGLSRKNNFTEQDIIHIKELYSSGLTSTQIGKQLNVGRTTIGDLLRANGVKTEHGCVRKQRVKHNPFKNLEDSETQYWLGWLASDGCISETGSIQLCSCLDTHILKDYIKFLGADVPLFEGLQHNKKSGKYNHKGNVGFVNHEVVKFLTNIGITPRKSLTLKLQIPLTWNILRGYYDGNGCLAKNKYTSIPRFYTASAAFKDQIVDFLRSEGFEPRIYKKPNQYVYEISICGFENITNIVNKMYSDNCIYLERKKPYYINNWRSIKDIS